MLDPIGQIQAEGFAFRQATSGKPKLLVVLGIWVLFFPGFLGFAIYLWLMIHDRSVGHGSDFLGLVIPFVFFVLIGLLLYQCTRNYLLKRKSA